MECLDEEQFRKLRVLLERLNSCWHGNEGLSDRLHTAITSTTTHLVVCNTEKTGRVSAGETGHISCTIKKANDMYMHAMLAGLWIVDFGWVERCLKAANAEETRELVTEPPEAYEVVGCGECPRSEAPKRAREELAAGMDGLFEGYCFHLVGGTPQERQRLKLMTHLGGGKAVMETESGRSSNRSTNQPGKSEWHADPFSAQSPNSGSDCEEVEDEEDGRHQVLVVALNPDKKGVVTSSFKVAKRVHAKAVVAKAWLEDCINQYQLISYHGKECYQLVKTKSTKDGEETPEKSRGSNSSRGPPSGKGKLQMVHHHHHEDKIFQDALNHPQQAVEGGEGLGTEDLWAIEASIALHKSTGMGESSHRVVVELGESSSEEDKPGVSYSKECEWERDFWDHLIEGGYMNKEELSLTYHVGSFWFDMMWERISSRRKVGKAAMERGCPYNICISWLKSKKFEVGLPSSHQLMLLLPSVFLPF
ncbi:unnamed protein product [Chrysoparadoxa australica]